MASTWASSWGTSWANSWGTVGAVTPTPARDSSDGGTRRGKRIIHVLRPEPEAPPEGVKAKRRLVTAEAVEQAVAQPWAGLWTVPEAMAILPKTVPVEFVSDGPPTETLIQAIALYLAREAERRAIEEDEEDVAMLLLSMH
jgi:hypothetical protein